MLTLIEFHEFYKPCELKHTPTYPRKVYQVYVHGSLFSDEPLPNINLPFKWTVRRFEIVFWCLSENAALFERLIKSHSNPPILNYGFKGIVMTLLQCSSIHNGIYFENFVVKWVIVKQNSIHWN